MLRHAGAAAAKPLSASSSSKLPLVNSFVELAMTGGGPRGSVCVETLSDRNVAVSALPGTGRRDGVFTYENAVGKFRFASKCVALRERIAAVRDPRADRDAADLRRRAAARSRAARRDGPRAMALRARRQRLRRVRTRFAHRHQPLGRIADRRPRSPAGNVHRDPVRGQHVGRAARVARRGHAKFRRSNRRRRYRWVYVSTG